MADAIREPEDWVSIDPGLQGTGLMFWTGKYPAGRDQHWEEIDLYTIRPPKKMEDWIERAVYIAETAEEMFESYEPTHVVIEQPFISLHGRKTLAAAATDSVVKLSVVAGMLIYAAKRAQEPRNDKFFHVTSILPAKWKGQLPDKAMKKRIEEWSKKCKVTLPGRISEHARDALGLGLSYLNLL